MSYKIGQKTKENKKYINFIDPLTNTTVKSLGYSGRKFEEYAIQLPEQAKFSTEETYYLNFSLQRFKGDELDVPGDEAAGTYTMTLSIYLLTINSDTGEYGSGERSTLVDALKVGTGEENFNYELIFTPNNNSYQYLAIMLQRTPVYDYQHDQYRQLINGTHDGKPYQRTITPHLGTIVNLLNEGVTAQKIGIQSKPGTLLQINGNPFRIGRTGVLEVNCGILITSIGITSPYGQPTNNFILDYAYED